MAVLKFYLKPALSIGKTKEKINLLQSVACGYTVSSINTEYCFYINVNRNLSPDEEKKLCWILTPSFQDFVRKESRLSEALKEKSILIEIGPRLNFSTPFSTNAVSISQSIGLPVSRIERSTRYLIEVVPKKEYNKEQLRNLENIFENALHDRMTECRYPEPITSFELKVESQPWTEVNILQEGRSALEKVSKDLGLAFDDWDLNYYTKLFKDDLKRNPTTVECFDLAQSNSEHSRHWFFKGRMIINGTEISESLIDLVMNTQKFTNPNSVIKFNDNSSAIKGYKVPLFVPQNSRKASYFLTKEGVRHIVFTAETHNFPTGVAPFSGAATGTGGRIRDVQAAGRGAHVVAGTAAYSFGNLNIPGYKLPWEDDSFDYPPNFAKPLEISVEASNGASDYGNKFGEPIISGFARSFGMMLPSGERREYIKPIMFTGGIGSIEEGLVTKFQAEKGMSVVKIGGPIYRIGVGGGAASSVHVQGDQKAELDFGAVQRGDAEMEQKLNRVIRACIEMEDKNIICSIHDQGAGGNGNVIKEIVEPAGAVIYTNRFQLGDPTISTMELWGAEYQESDAILVKSSDEQTLKTISNREKCPVNFVGDVVGDGRIVLKENDSSKRHPVDLELAHVLGSMPRKVFNLERKDPLLKPLSLPTTLNVKMALDRVLRLPSVASKRYLTNKVDRCVTGLIAQQQCVGPLHTPLADVAVVALSYFDTVGSATSIGEQPIKGLLDPAAGARMSVAEAITNLMFAEISSLQDVKCSGNWMWAAKLPGEGAALYDACQAMCKTMGELGIAIDGGKDSLSMAARVGKETVKAPGTLVISTYAPCSDVRKTVTPDLKCPSGKGTLLYIDISNGKGRLGGTALAQCFKQLGDEVPDLENAKSLRDAFSVTQQLIKEGKLTAGHDVSDGGVITCVLEMSFAGNHGITVDISNRGSDVMGTLFGEEVGWVIEVAQSDAPSVIELYNKKGILCQRIGHSIGFAKEADVKISVNGVEILHEKMILLRDIWEDTSFQLELFQTATECVQQEKNSLANRTAPPYHLTFDPSSVPVRTSGESGGPRVAVIREEGINGDREMIAALFMAGFEAWDVTITDLLGNQIKLDQFQGIVFPGGFSYADVLGSAKGWAAGLKFHPELESQFASFYNRSDTFSLGVCNGCQLMGLLGWVSPTLNEQGKPCQGVHLTHNLSERFESRFLAVKVEESPAIMLKGMHGSVLGVWAAHGEGRFVFKNKSILETVESQKVVSLRYVDDNGKPTEDYPCNPNGSVSGIASLCSSDGRHLAMMPHPERSVFPWQWAWMPYEWQKTMKVSPWVKMFRNAYEWCLLHKS